MVVILLMSTPLPDLSFTVNVTTGALPGVAPVTLITLVTSPGSDVEFEGMRCEPGMELSKSETWLALWQFLPCLSSGSTRLTWFKPVAKFTSSWQEPHAAAPGLVFQASAWVAAAAWQTVQLRTSCGKTTVEKSDQAPRCQIRYGVPAFTLGRFAPMWILWIRTGMSCVSCVSGFTVWGVWHMMQSSTATREPPC